MTSTVLQPTDDDSLFFGDTLAQVRSLSEILADPTIHDTPPFVLRPLCVAGRSTLLCAPPKAGKSTLTSQLAADLSAGRRSLLHARQVAPCEPAQVLWLALDEHVGDVARRLHACGADPERVHIIDQQVDPRTIVGTAAVMDASLIVVDTLRRLLPPGISLNSDADVLPFLTPMLLQLRALDSAALLILHHSTAKAGGADFLGSTSLAAEVDAVAVMRADGTEGVRTVDILGRWGAHKLRLQYADERYHHIGDGPRETVLHVQVRTVLLALRDAAKPLRNAEWMRTSATPKTSFERARRFLLEQGYVVLADELYAITANGEQVLAKRSEP